MSLVLGGTLLSGKALSGKAGGVGPVLFLRRFTGASSAPAENAPVKRRKKSKGPTPPALPESSLPESSAPPKTNDTAPPKSTGALPESAPPKTNDAALRKSKGSPAPALLKKKPMKEHVFKEPLKVAFDKASAKPDPVERGWQLGSDHVECLGGDSAADIHFDRTHISLHSLGRRSKL